MGLEINKINSILNELKGLKIKEAVSLRKRLRAEKQKISTPKSRPAPTSNVFDANKKRSSFMKGVWRYIKLLRDTYPELREKFTARQMFSQYFARRRGEGIDISDVFWQNPS